MITDKEWLLDVNTAYEKGKLKGRADAIDEVWKLSKEHSVVDAMGIRCIDLSVLDLILEQLKEQK